ncbi:MAG: hypothetical protein ACYDCN_12435 [Bacteroidia bacterium]
MNGEGLIEEGRKNLEFLLTGLPIWVKDFGQTLVLVSCAVVSWIYIAIIIITKPVPELLI